MYVGGAYELLAGRLKMSSGQTGQRQVPTYHILRQVFWQDLFEDSHLVEVLELVPSIGKIRQSLSLEL